jgi:hypothetical protein
VGKHVHKLPADVLWLATIVAIQIFPWFFHILPGLVEQPQLTSHPLWYLILQLMTRYPRLQNSFFTQISKNIVLAKHGRFSNSHHFDLATVAIAEAFPRSSPESRLDASPLSRAATPGAFHGASGVGGSGGAGGSEFFSAGSGSKPEPKPQNFAGKAGMNECSSPQIRWYNWNWLSHGPSP